MPSQIPASRVPLLDPSTNTMTNEWYRWFVFLNLLNGNGNNDVTLTDLQVAPNSYQGATDVVPQMRAIVSAGYTLAGAGNNQIAFNAIEIDTANEFNTSTNLWTPSKTGVYAVSAGVGFSNTQLDASKIELKVYKGPLTTGSRWQYFYYNAIGAAITPQVNGADTVFPVTAGDTYSIVVSVPGTGAAILADRGATWFSAAFQPPTYQA